MVLPSATNARASTGKSVIVPSNFTRSPQPKPSTYYDPQPPKSFARQQAENSFRQYNFPKPTPKEASAPRQTITRSTPSEPISYPQGLDYGKPENAKAAKAFADLKQQAQTRDLIKERIGRGSTQTTAAKSPVRLSPLPSAKSAPPIGSFNRGGGFGSSGMGMGMGEVAATSLALDYLNSNGLPNYPSYNPGNSLVEQVGRDIGNLLNGNALKDLSRSSVGDRLADLLNLFPNPYENKPRTDPKNDDSRPKPTRYTSQWRGVKFWSPNNRSYVRIAAPNGQYSLGEIKDGFGG